MACAYAKYAGKLATSGPGAIHLLNGSYDAKADNTHVIAITGTTYSDLMNSSYQQGVNLLQLYSDVTVYNDMLTVTEQAEMAVDIACRTALAQRGVAHLTIPIDWVKFAEACGGVGYAIKEPSEVKSKMH